ncbi:MAG: S41 family peptidase [Planctomycetia bacterium]|nr:S41 family peptidase [Planctomycetia bacterium]
MRFWVLVRRSAPCWLALTLFALVPVRAAELAGSVAPTAAVEDLARDFLERGKLLENERRWGEALSLYEEALRGAPGHEQLHRRHDVVKLRYDVGRRYGSPAFQRSTSSLEYRQALDLYTEVLHKIQTNYVDRPDWHVLVDRGTAALDVALVEPSFAERLMPRIAQERVDRFRRLMREQPPSRNVDTIDEARAAVDRIARVGQRDLGLDARSAVMEYLCGAANLLDPYSTFLTSDQLDELYSQIEGNFVGLGVELKAEGNKLLIVRVIRNSPAARAGLLAGDHIVGVDGKKTAELNADVAADLLQGPEGSTVEVTAKTPGQTERALKIRREYVEVPSVDDVKIVDADYHIGYLKLTCFQKTTTRDLDEALWKLHQQGMRSLVMDLRGNPGGLLTTSVEVADKFLDHGTIVSTRGRNKREDFNYTAEAPDTWGVPLVVLIDGDSASASEIFAGAIRDYHRGTIVGVRSYGKGSVQGLFPLSIGNAGMRLTTAKFYSPLGKPFSGIGVEPDVQVQTVNKPIAQTESEVATLRVFQDETLEAGLTIARQQTAQR